MARKRRLKGTGGNSSLAASPSVSPSPSPARPLNSMSEAELALSERGSTAALDAREELPVDASPPAPPLASPFIGDPDAVYTIADVARALSDELLEWALMDVVLETHRNQFLSSSDGSDFLRTGTAVPPSTSQLLGNNANTRCGVNPFPAGQQASIDSIMAATGVLHVDKNVNVECNVCSSSIAASRYAQHLEKCLGRGGRSSSRAASARLKASAEKAEKEAAADQDELSSRRRRGPPLPSAHGPNQAMDTMSGIGLDRAAESSGTGNAHGHPTAQSHAFPVGTTKRRKSSPGLESLGSGGGAFGSVALNGRKGGNLPPSGRSRP
jgi:Sgf11 (transcriptional regulation protein)